MNTTGRILSLNQDLVSQKISVTLQLETEDTDELRSLIDSGILNIKIDKQRSLGANALFHILVGEIAELLTISKTKAKNILICRYGQPMLDATGEPMLYCTAMPEEEMYEMSAMHAAPVNYVKNGDETMTVYQLFRGTHTYTTKEMSKLIDGAQAELEELT